MRPTVRKEPAFSRTRTVLHTRSSPPTRKSAARFVSPALTDFAQVEALLAMPPRRIENAELTPYGDYSRIFTLEGGVLLTYRDLDLRLRHTLWRLFAWSSFTGTEGWFLAFHPPVPHPFVCFACFCLATWVNWRIVSDPVVVLRSIEIRPDCMILDGIDLFWTNLMEGGAPQFQPDETGGLTLCGIYGTRWIAYLRVLRFGKADRSPEALRWHVEDAIRQIWQPPHIAGQDR